MKTDSEGLVFGKDERKESGPVFFRMIPDLVFKELKRQAELDM